MPTKKHAIFHTNFHDEIHAHRGAAGRSARSRSKRCLTRPASRSPINAVKSLGSSNELISASVKTCRGSLLNRDHNKVYVRGGNKRERCRSVTQAWCKCEGKNLLTNARETQEMTRLPSTRRVIRTADRFMKKSDEVKVLRCTKEPVTK